MISNREESNLNIELGFDETIGVPAHDRIQKSCKPNMHRNTTNSTKCVNNAQYLVINLFVVFFILKQKGNPNNPYLLVDIKFFV